MKRFALILLTSFVFASWVSAQDAPATDTKTAVKALRTPDLEVEDAIIFLQGLPENDRNFVKFFTTYPLPEDLRQDSVLVATFLMHSMMGVKGDSIGGIYPLARIENEEFIPVQQVSDTLWWFDTRQFNWSIESWEKLASVDGYFVEPVISHEKYSAMRLMSGNAVIRIDWFITHAIDLAKQKDYNSDVRIYREMIYGDTPPKNVKEFEAAWSIDTEKAREIGNVYAALVTKSREVARHNRLLFGYRTELGWYYRSYDVNHMQGKRDYAESLLDQKGNPPEIFDGGEIFATNPLYLQVYELYNAKEELAEFGDPTLVRHLGDITNDPRVRTAYSCMDCHAAGPIPSENTINEFIESRLGAYIYDYNDKLRITRTYLSERFEDSIGENQALFAKSLLKINGLTPDENAAALNRLTAWYAKDVNLGQAAFECGLTVDTFVKKVSEESKVYPDRVPIRLALCIANKENIPRDIWESPSVDGIPGLFQQSMVRIHGLTAVTQETIVYQQYVIETEARMMSGEKEVCKIPVGASVKQIGEIKDGWIYCEYSDSGKIHKGYVYNTFVTKK